MTLSSSVGAGGNAEEAIPSKEESRSVGDKSEEGLGPRLVVVGFAHEGTMNSFRQTIGYLMLAFLMIAMAYVAVANFQEL